VSDMSSQVPRDDPFRWILDVGAAMVRGSRGREGLMEMAAAIGRAMNVTGVDIQSYDKAGDCLIQEASWDASGNVEEDLAYIGTRIPLDESPSFNKVVALKAIDEVHSDDPDMLPDDRELFDRWGYKATLDAPLMVGGEVVGVLGITEDRYIRRFKSMERERFEQLAAMTAAAIRNMRLSARERMQSGRLEALLEVTAALSVGPSDGVIAVAERVCREQLGAARAEVRRGDGLLETTMTTLHQAAQLPEDDPLRADMDQRGEAWRLNVPVIYMTRPHGLLTLAWPEAQEAFDEDAQRFVEAVAEQLAAALENEALAGAGR
jgi:GAF domain-containing protein